MAKKPKQPRTDDRSVAAKILKKKSNEGKLKKPKKK